MMVQANSIEARESDGSKAHSNWWQDRRQGCSAVIEHHRAVIDTHERSYLGSNSSQSIFVKDPTIPSEQFISSSNSKWIVVCLMRTLLTWILVISICSPFSKEDMTDWEALLIEYNTTRIMLLHKEKGFRRSWVGEIPGRISSPLSLPHPLFRENGWLRINLNPLPNPFSLVICMTLQEFISQLHFDLFCWALEWLQGDINVFDILPRCSRCAVPDAFPGGGDSHHPSRLASPNIPEFSSCSSLQFLHIPPYTIGACSVGEHTKHKNSSWTDFEKLH